MQTNKSVTQRLSLETKILRSLLRLVKQKLTDTEQHNYPPLWAVVRTRDCKNCFPQRFQTITHTCSCVLFVIRSVSRGEPAVYIRRKLLFPPRTHACVFIILSTAADVHSQYNTFVCVNGKN